jgi:hypothetical protein
MLLIRMLVSRGPERGRAFSQRTALENLTERSEKPAAKISRELNIGSAVCRKLARK